MASLRPWRPAREIPIALVSMLPIPRILPIHPDMLGDGKGAHRCGAIERRVCGWRRCFTTWECWPRASHRSRRGPTRWSLSRLFAIRWHGAAGLAAGCANRAGAHGGRWRSTRWIKPGARTKTTTRGALAAILASRWRKTTTSIDSLPRRRSTILRRRSTPPFSAELAVPFSENRAATRLAELAAAARLPRWVDGRMLEHAGLTPGPKLGQLLRRAARRQVQGRFGDAEEAIAWAAAEVVRLQEACSASVGADVGEPGGTNP